MLRGILLVVLIVLLIRSYDDLKRSVQARVGSDALSSAITLISILVLIALGNYILEKVLIVH